MSGERTLSEAPRHLPKRTCTGCRTVEPQAKLLRVSSELQLDPGRKLPGRGAYVHARPACITVAGLARSFRRPVTPNDVQRLVRDMSAIVDNSSDLLRKNGAGLECDNAVEPPTPVGASSRG